MTTSKLDLHPAYRPDIDGLRAVAVLSVIAYHAFPNLLTGGFVGVDIFFVISGFLISSIIFNGLEQHRFSFVEFYARRIRRIFPALALVLVCCLGYGWLVLLPDEFRQLGKHTLAGAGFVSNLVLNSEAGYFDTAAELKPLLHLWSLGIEEQYYIVWPLLLIFAFKRGNNLRWLIVAIVMLSFSINLAKIGRHPVSAFFLPQSRFWELLVGSSLAYLAVFKQAPLFASWRNQFAARLPIGLQSEIHNLRAIAGGLLIMAALFGLDRTQPYPGWRALLPTLGALLVISAGPAAWVNRNILAHPAMVFVGLISYPLYLWNWPLLVFPRIVSAVPPSPMVRGGR